MHQVAEWKTFASSAGTYKDYPGDIDFRLKSVLIKMGFDRLYTHQAEAYGKVRSGENIVVVTPTASGKTLCYNLPVIQTVLEQPDTRALYLFPTKALSQDQVVELQGMVELLEEDIKTFTFDGDTPVNARRAIRTAGHIVVTNPDMLHQGILPHHTRWIKLFENLKYVVIDEIHHYRGVFGSHLANLIRRLRRICRFYKSDPLFICCSATIANPAELAENIIQGPVHLIDQNGAPRAEKHFILYNPPVVNRQLGIRRSVIKEATRIARKFLLYGVQTILFARSRMNVEILTTYLRDMMGKNNKPSRRVVGYRGGYLPNERREIERGLRSGDIRGVVSTNALELGIDIGQLDSCIMVGYPGTVASTWQQAGRAGRKAGISAAIMVASSSPLDQYIINHPDYFFGKSPESGVVNPNNLVILMSHVKCAAFELPFESGELFGIDATEELLEYLEEHEVLQKQSGRYHWTSEAYPAEQVSLRSATPENFVIVDTTTQDHRVIGEVDLYTAPLLVHNEAIYIHQGRQFHVDQLDWDRRKAYVRKVDVDYYTDAEVKTDIKVLDVFEEQEQSLSCKAHGEISVTTTPTMYKKIKLHTHENVGSGKILLPELEMHTTSYMWQIHGPAEAEVRSNGFDFGAGMKGLGNIMGMVAPLYVMCDPQDVKSVPMLKSPFHKEAALYIYDSYPGGVGFSEKLYGLHYSLLHAAAELIQGCPCDAGCPSCVGPVLEVGETGKQSTLRIVEIGLRDE
jgi:DEAD/DEAH box helicase domain-containing protein